jgi:hypothetical protein
MEKIEEKLNNLYISEMPMHLHSSIMKKVNYKKAKPFVLVVLCLLVLNFIVIAWHINTKLIDAEFGVMMNDLFADFDLSFSFANTVLTSFFEIISPALVVSLALSFFGTIYIIRKNSFLFNFYKS